MDGRRRAGSETRKRANNPGETNRSSHKLSVNEQNVRQTSRLPNLRHRRENTERFRRKMFDLDNDDPYIYVRTQPENNYDVLIVGGEDHRTGQAEDFDARFGRLVQWTQKRFPEATEILYKWSGQYLETHDGLAFIGKYSDSEPNVFLITAIREWE
jgi:glycine/D-amino acid oxidase-like deaminating enzyme